MQTRFLYAHFGFAAESLQVVWSRMIDGMAIDEKHTPYPRLGALYYQYGTRTSTSTNVAQSRNSRPENMGVFVSPLAVETQVVGTSLILWTRGPQAKHRFREAEHPRGSVTDEISRGH